MNRSIYFSEQMEKNIKRDAKKRKTSVSKIVNEILERHYATVKQ